MATPIDPVSAVGTALPPPGSHALPGAAMPPGEPLMQSSLQALHQAAQAPDGVGRGVRTEQAARSSAPMELLNHLTKHVIVPAREAAGLPAVPGVAEEATLNQASIEGLQRVSTFAIQTSVQLATESTMLSVTSALASAANTTFHQLLSSNE